MNFPNIPSSGIFRLWLPLFAALWMAAIPVKADNPPGSNAIKTVIKTAESYLGTPHRMGGTNRSGIDCSGLMYRSFLAADYTLPRVSRDQAQIGKAVKRAKIQRGDLVFFAKNGRIFHVGLVIENRAGEVLFIHTSSSRGVMKSKLSETYWKKHYATARRVWKNTKALPIVEAEAPQPVGHITVLDTADIGSVPGRFPITAQRILKKSELKGFSSKKLRFMRNEIFARHGYTFRSRDLRKYFQKQSWYRKLSKTKDLQVVSGRLSEIEKINISLIRRME